MSDPLHQKQLPNDGVHAPFAWKFSSEPSRLNFSPSEGSPLTQAELTSEDLTRWALQTDNNTVWMLSSLSPLTWVQMNPTSTFSGSITGGGDPGASYLVLSLTSSLSAERTFNVSGTSGLRAVDSGPGGSLSLSINDNLVATLTGSRFTGPVVAAGGLSGSLQQVGPGIPYLLAQGGITITSQSNGQIIISGSSGGSGGANPVGGVGIQVTGGNIVNIDTAVVAQLSDSTFVKLSGSLQRLSSGQTYIAGAGAVSIVTSSTGQVIVSASAGVTPQSGIGVNVSGTGVVSINDNVVATISGSTFTGPVVASGGLSGSLQKTSGGLSYLIGVGGTSITSQSNGQILVSSSAPQPNVAGVGISVTGSVINIDPAVVAQLAGATFVKLSGSLQRLATGETFIAGAGTVSVTTSSNGQVVVSGSSLPPVAGSGVLVSDRTVSIDPSIVATLSGATFSQLSGSLQKTNAGLSYLVGSGGTTITSQSNGQIVVSSSVAQNPTAGTGITVSGLQISVDPNVVVARSGSSMTGPLTLLGGVSGSLQRLTTGETFIAGVGGVSVTTGSNGQVLISGSNGALPIPPSAGVGVTVSGYQVSVDPNIVVMRSGSSMSGPLVLLGGLSGSLQRLATGETYIAGSGGVSVTTGSNGQIIISGSNGALPIPPSAGTGITVSGFQVSVDPNVVVVRSGSSMSGPLVLSGGLTGSLQQTVGGLSYLVGVGAVSIVSQSNGQILVSASNDTTVAGTGLTKTSNALNIDNNIVATVSGTTFTGVVRAPFLSGSLQRLTTGETAFAGVGGVSITTGSNGQILISGSNDTTVSAGTGLTKAANALSIDNSVVATVSGTTFTGVVKAPFLSGSLQRLTTGETAFVAGQNITIVTQSNGQVQISALAGPVNSNWFQSSWYVDSVGGLDTNTGLTGSALRTTEELARRLCPGGQVAVLQQDTNIFLQGTFTELALNIDWFPGAAPIGAQLLIQGFVSSSAPILLSAVVNTNSATNTRGELTTASGTFVSKKRIRSLVGNATAMAYCTGLNAGPQNAFVGQFYDWNAGAPVTVTNGTNVVVDTLTTTVNRLVITTQGNGYTVFKDLIISNGARCTNNSIADQNVEFWGCEIAGATAGSWSVTNSAYLYQCRITSFTYFIGAEWYFTGCSFQAPANIFASYARIDYSVLDGGQLQQVGTSYIGFGSDLEIENGMAGAAWSIGDGSNARVGNAFKLWGASTAYSTGIQVGTGGWLFINAPGAISFPSTINYLINNQNFLYAQAPIVINRANCGVAVINDTFASTGLQAGPSGSINPAFLIDRWYIDATIGSDLSSGLTPSTALRTPERLAEILCPNGTFWNPQQNTVIYIGSGSYNRLALNATYAQSINVTIQGTVSSSSPITLTAVTTSVASTSVRGGLATTAGVFVAQKRIRAISGTASGSITYSTGLDNDAQHTFVKPFFRESDSSLTFPSVSDNVVVEQPLTNINTIQIVGSAVGGGQGTATSLFTVKDIVHRDTYGAAAFPNSLGLIFSQCEISGTSTGALNAVTYNNCRTIIGTGGKTMSTLFTLYQGCVFQAGISATGFGNYRIGPACAFDGGFFSMNHPTLTSQTGFTTLKLLNDLELCNGAGQTAFYVGHGCQLIVNARIWNSGSSGVYATGFNTTAGGWCYTAAAANLTFQSTTPIIAAGRSLTGSLTGSIPFSIPRSNTGFGLTSDTLGVTDRGQSFSGSYFVDPTYTGIQNGSEQAPFQTVAAAFGSALASGVTAAVIWLATTTFTENIVFPTSGQWELAGVSNWSYQNTTLAGTVTMNSNVSTTRFALTNLLISGITSGSSNSGGARVQFKKCVFIAPITLSRTGGGTWRVIADGAGGPSTLSLGGGFSQPVSIAGQLVAQAYAVTSLAGLLTDSTLLNCQIDGGNVSSANTTPVSCSFYDCIFSVPTTFSSSNTGGFNARLDGPSMTSLMSVGGAIGTNASFKTINSNASARVNVNNNIAASNLTGLIPTSLMAAEGTLTLLTTGTVGSAVLNVIYTDLNGSIKTRAITPPLDITSALGTEVSGSVLFSQNGATNIQYSVTGIVTPGTLTASLGVVVRKCD